MAGVQRQHLACWPTSRPVRPGNPPMPTEARQMLRPRKRALGTALIVIFTLVVIAACSATGGRRAAEAQANAGSAGHADTPRYTFDVITHAEPGDTFWDIIRSGASAAAAKDNISYHYSSDPDPTKEAQLIT